MKDFDAIQELWQQAAVQQGPAMPAAAPRKVVSNKRKLMRQQIIGLTSMLLTFLFITWMIYFTNINLYWTITYVGVGMIQFVLLAQAVVLYYTWKMLSRIDDTQTPQQHIQQWESYYAFRQKQTAWNKPVYFVLLNIAMGLYFLEIFHKLSVLTIVIFAVVYTAWMLYAYLVLGKRSLRKESDRLQQIISELKQLEQQLSAAESL